MTNETYLGKRAERLFGLPKEWVVVILGAATIAWLSLYFVPRKEYDKDQSILQMNVSEMKQDIKEILKQNRNR